MHEPNTTRTPCANTPKRHVQPRDVVSLTHGLVVVQIRPRCYVVCLCKITPPHACDEHIKVSFKAADLLRESCGAIRVAHLRSEMVRTLSAQT